MILKREFKLSYFEKEYSSISNNISFWIQEVEKDIADSVERRKIPWLEGLVTGTIFFFLELQNDKIFFFLPLLLTVIGIHILIKGYYDFPLKRRTLALLRDYRQHKMASTLDRLPPLQ